jgi:hypothetical protein
MGVSTRIETHEAIELLGSARSRTARWVVSMAAIGIREGYASRLSTLPCVVTVNGERLTPREAKERLVIRQPIESGLADSLRLAVQIDPEFLRQTADAMVVREWLQKQGALPEKPTTHQLLNALCTRGKDNPIHLSVDQLRMVRVELQKLGDDERVRLGRRLGASIVVDGYSFLDGKRVDRHVRPINAYLSQSIDKQDDGLTWALAAGTVAGVEWIGPGYRETLTGQRQGDRFGPAALLRLLGAENAPRVSARESTTSMRDESGCHITGAEPDYQRKVLANLSHEPDALLNDSVSPHLSAVIRDIAASAVGEGRSRRARALLAALGRAWDRYRTRATATAAYSYYTFNRLGSVPATWIADAASVQWLTNQANAPARPCDLVSDTLDNVLVFQDLPEKFPARTAAKGARDRVRPRNVDDRWPTRGNSTVPQAN